MVIVKQKENYFRNFLLSTPQKGSLTHKMLKETKKEYTETSQKNMSIEVLNLRCNRSKP